MTRFVPLLILLLAGCVSVGVSRNNAPGPTPEEARLVIVSSRFSVDETFQRLRDAIEGNDALSIMAVVDHAQNAEGAGMQLPPTRLIIFGNPRLGTPLMQERRTMAIDLPQKMLVWQTEGGEVRLAYNDPAYLARRHGLNDTDEVLQQISNALANLAAAATGG